MALYQDIQQDDGITTSYHRVLFVQITTNRQNSIAVLSYVNEKARANISTGDFRPYTRSTTYETDYDPYMTIETAYDYLKTLPEFEGAENI